MLADVPATITATLNNYLSSRDQRTKLADTYLVFLVLVALVQFVFAISLGSFPFNAFLAGFISTVGQFVLVVSLKLQSQSDKKQKLFGIGPERAIGDFVFGSLILHFIVWHFVN